MRILCLNNLVQVYCFDTSDGTTFCNRVCFVSWLDCCPIPPQAPNLLCSNGLGGKGVLGFHDCSNCARYTLSASTWCCWDHSNPSQLYAIPMVHGLEVWTLAGWRRKSNRPIWSWSQFAWALSFLHMHRTANRPVYKIMFVLRQLPQGWSQEI